MMDTRVKPAYDLTGEDTQDVGSLALGPPYAVSLRPGNAAPDFASGPIGHRFEFHNSAVSKHDFALSPQIPREFCFYVSP
jgi:hypothetical protein